MCVYILSRDDDWNVDERPLLLRLLKELLRDKIVWCRWRRWRGLGEENIPESAPKSRNRIYTPVHIYMYTVFIYI